jgi:hypothetical protein
MLSSCGLSQTSGRGRCERAKHKTRPPHGAAGGSACRPGPSGRLSSGEWRRGERVPTRGCA